MPTRRRALLILAALAGLSQLSIALALMVGSIPISPLDVLATLVDLTADWALVSTTGRGVPTIDMRVDYHRAAMKGDLVCKGKVVKSGKQFSVCEASIFNEAGQLLASGRGVYAMPAPKAA